MQDLETEKRRNSDLEALNLRNKKEISHLHKTINGLRSSMDLHVQDVENVIENNLAISSANIKSRKEANSNPWPNPPIDSTFGTVDLELSSDHSSAVNSPLPTDPPNINVPNKQFEERDRLQPLQLRSRSNLFDQGTLKLSEDKDDDVDSAIGISESHPLISGTSSSTRQHNKEHQIMGHSVSLQVNTDVAGGETSHVSNMQTKQHPKRSLGEEIQILHKYSQEQKFKQNTVMAKAHETSNQHEKFEPASLNLSDTIDSQRLETSVTAIGLKNVMKPQELIATQQRTNLLDGNSIPVDSRTDKMFVENSSHQLSWNLPPPPYPMGTKDFGSGDRKSNHTNSLKNRSALEEKENIEIESDLKKNAKETEDQRYIYYLGIFLEYTQPTPFPPATI